MGRASDESSACAGCQAPVAARYGSGTRTNRRVLSLISVGVVIASIGVALSSPRAVSAQGSVPLCPLPRPPADVVGFNAAVEAALEALLLDAGAPAQRIAQRLVEPELRLGVKADDIAASLFGEVARILAEDVLDQPTELVPLPNVDAVEQLLQGGVHVLLGADPDVSVELRNASADGSLVDRMGVLGPINRASFYMPSFLLVNHSSLAREWVLGPGLATISSVFDDAAVLVPSTRRADQVAEPVLVETFNVTLNATVNETVWIVPEVADFMSTTCDAADYLAALGAPLLPCNVSADDTALVRWATELYDRGSPFLAFLPSAHRLHATLDLTRVELPNDMEASVSELSSQPLESFFHVDGRIGFPAKIHHLLRELHVSDGDLSIMLADLAARRLNTTDPSSVTFAEVACAWLQGDWWNDGVNSIREDQEQSVDVTAADGAPPRLWVNKALRVDDVAPHILASHGGEWMYVKGDGFGVRPPRVADDLRIRVGGQECQRSEWLSPTSVRCMTPQWSGLHLAVEVEVGFVKTTAGGAVSYEAAVLRGIGDAALLIDDARRTVTAGEAVLITGYHFSPAPSLKCRFETLVVTGTFINSTAMTCPVPLGFHGRANIAVTNDNGSRWSTGIAVSVDDIGWGTNTGDQPVDYIADLVPPLARFVLLGNEEANDNFPAIRSAVRAAVDEVNHNVSCLRYTRIDLLEERSEAALAASAAEVDDATLAVLTEIYDETWTNQRDESLRRTQIDLYVFIDATTPLASASFNKMMRHLDVPSMMLSIGTSTPVLSSPTLNPYYMRLTPSEHRDVDALVRVLEHLSEEGGLFKYHKLWTMPPQTEAGKLSRAVAVLADEEDFYFATTFKEMAREVGINVAVTVRVPPRIVLGREDLTVESATTLLSAITQTRSRVIVAFLSADRMEIALEAADVLSLLDNRHLWLGPTTFTASEVVRSHITHAIGLRQAPAPSEAADAMISAAREESGVTSGLAAIAADAVFTAAQGLDHVTRQLRDSRGWSYQDARLVRSSFTTGAQKARSVSGFARFDSGERANDPAMYTYEIMSWGPLSPRETIIPPGTIMRPGLVLDEAAIPHVVGLVNHAGLVNVPDFDAVVMPVGNGEWTFQAPAVLELGLPFHLAMESSRHVIAGAEVALHEINSDELILPGSTLRVRLTPLYETVEDVDDPDAPEEVLDAYGSVTALLEESTFLVGILAAQTTPEVLGLAEAGQLLKVPTVSPTATADVLSDPHKFTHFLRTVPPDHRQAFALVQAITRLEWGIVGTIYEPGDPYSSGLHEDFVEAAAAGGLRIGESMKVNSTRMDAERLQLEEGLQNLTGAASLRVIVLLTSNEVGCHILDVAEHLSLAAGPYQWVGSDAWISDHPLCPAYDGLDIAYKGSVGTAPPSVQGTSQLESIRKFKARLAAPVSDVISGDEELLHAVTNMRNTTFGFDEAAADSMAPPNWGASAAYSAVQLFARALHEMLVAEQDVSNGDELMEVLRTRVAPSPVGQLVFRELANDPMDASFDILNRVDDTSVAQVGFVADAGFVLFRGCLPGEFRDAVTDTCVPCPVDHFKSTHGDLQCTRCPKYNQFAMTTNGVVGATRLDQCLCPMGLMTAVSPGAALDAAGNFSCQECPKGAYCDRIGIHVYQVKNDIGYWRGDPNSTKFTECISRQRCGVRGLTLPTPTSINDPAVHTGTRLLPSSNIFVSTFTHTTPCPDGYAGPVCEVCWDGYGKVESGDCVKCPGDGDHKSVSMLSAGLSVLLFLAIAFWLTVWQFRKGNKVLNANRRFTNIRLLISFFQLNAFLAGFELGWAQVMVDMFDVQMLLSQSHVAFVPFGCMPRGGSDVTSSPFLLEFIFYAGQPIVAVGVGLLLFVGIGCGHAVSRGARQRAARRVEDRERELELDGPVMTQGFEWTKHARKKRSEWSEVYTCRCFGACFPRLCACCNRRGVFGGGRTTSVGCNSPFWTDFVISFILITFHLMYPRVAMTVFKMLDCREIDGRYLLRVDLGVSCDSAMYLRYQVAAVAVGALFVLGLPFMLYRTLFVHRDKLEFNVEDSKSRIPHLVVNVSDVNRIQRAFRKLSRDLHWGDMPDVQCYGSALIESGVVRNKLALKAITTEQCDMAVIAMMDIQRREQERRADILAEQAAAEGQPVLNASIRRKLLSSYRSFAIRGGLRCNVVPLKEMLRTMERRFDLVFMHLHVLFETKFAIIEDGLTAAKGRKFTNLVDDVASSRKDGDDNPADALQRKMNDMPGLAAREAVWATLPSTEKVTKRLQAKRHQLQLKWLRIRQLLQAGFMDAVLHAVRGRRSLNDSVHHVHSKMLNVAQFQRRMGFFYTHYRPGVAYYEVWNMCRKLALAAMAVFLGAWGKDKQFASGMVFVVFCIAITYVVNPYMHYSVLAKYPSYSPWHIRLMRRAVRRWYYAKHMFDPDVPVEVLRPPDKWLVGRTRVPLLDRVPEVLSTARLEKASMFTLAANLAVGQLNDPSWTDSATRTVVWDAIFMLNILLVAVFVVVICIDMWIEAHFEAEDFGMAPKKRETALSRSMKDAESKKRKRKRKKKRTRSKSRDTSPPATGNPLAGRPTLWAAVSTSGSADEKNASPPLSTAQIESAVAQNLNQFGDGAAALRAARRFVSPQLRQVIDQRRASAAGGAPPGGVKLPGLGSTPRTAEVQRGRGGGGGGSSARPAGAPSAAAAAAALANPVAPSEPPPATVKRGRKSTAAVSAVTRMTSASRMTSSSRGAANPGEVAPLSAVVPGSADDESKAEP